MGAMKIIVPAIRRMSSSVEVVSASAIAADVISTRIALTEATNWTAPIQIAT